MSVWSLSEKYLPIYPFPAVLRSSLEKRDLSKIKWKSPLYKHNESTGNMNGRSRVNKILNLTIPPFVLILYILVRIRKSKMLLSIYQIRECRQRIPSFVRTNGNSFLLAKEEISGIFFERHIKKLLWLNFYIYSI